MRDALRRAPAAAGKTGWGLLWKTRSGGRIRYQNRGGMAKQLVSINGSVLTWAREEDGLSPEELADRMKVPVAEIRSWEAGEDYPGRTQFARLAQVLGRPSAIFYLPEPPVKAGIPIKFRRAPGPDGRRLGRDELRQIRQAQRMQQITSWVVRDSGAGPVALEPVERKRDPARVGEEERRASGVSADEQIGWRDAYESFRNWRWLLERNGILVFQMRMGKDGIRGFSIWDDYAPAAVVNTAYHPTARIFTLFHEVGHLLTRTGAACLEFVGPGDSEVDAERWCEQFAASFLLPAEGLRLEAMRQGAAEGSKVDDPQTARRLANRFSVSARAMAIRLHAIGLAEAGLYGAVASKFPNQDWSDSAGGGRGQTATRKRITEYGRLLPAILFSAADRGRLHERDLTDYLELTTGQVKDLRGELVGT